MKLSFSCTRSNIFGFILRSFERNNSRDLSRGFVPIIQESYVQNTKIYIASSTESRNRGIVPKLVQLLGAEDFEVKPWYKQFPNGAFALDVLLDLPEKVDVALFVFGKDDVREFRGSKDHMTRDNVILEYGIFASRLGRPQRASLGSSGRGS